MCPKKDVKKSQKKAAPPLAKSCDFAGEGLLQRLFFR